jgi:hypothetical protein
MERPGRPDRLAGAVRRLEPALGSRAGSWGRAFGAYEVHALIAAGGNGRGVSRARIPA